MVSSLGLLRPRWPSGKVSTPGPEGRRFEIRFHRRSAVHGARCTPNHTQWPNVLPLVWRGSLERECQLRRRPRHLTAVQNYEPSQGSEKLSRWGGPFFSTIVIARLFLVVTSVLVVDDTGNDFIVLQYLIDRVIDIKFEPVLNVFLVAFFKF
ncbi:hypothetical protein AVEN_123807-1 [Araneus ventricosus]|uniref:Uncharacterized protein n=1 Tax=Araneus ventricosus TaxID=182803 RepID=A0A4Y2BLQ4_ARAVE|nr:hypothetical protein AVEN_123807-1 [Araneus ventricosus]